MIEETGKAKFKPPPVWLKDQVRQQQTLSGSRVLTTNTGQRNTLNFTAAFLYLAARERPRHTSAPSVTGLGVVPCVAEYHIKVNV
jgi:hypothetical protein